MDSSVITASLLKFFINDLIQVKGRGCQPSTSTTGYWKFLQDRQTIQVSHDHLTLVSVQLLISNF